MTSGVLIALALTAVTPGWSEDGALRPVRIHGLSKPIPTHDTRVTALDPIALIGTLPETFYDAVVFADTDHDGNTECFIDAATGARILEFEAGQFVQRGFISGIFPYAAGDLDQDGKADLVGEFGQFLRVYEAIDEHSFPSLLVWQSPPLSNTVGYPAIADTDGDGQLEIVHSRNGGASHLMIYECVGDNSFALRFVAPTEPQYVGRKLIADLNQNGHMDIATCGSDGYVRVLEAKANDTWDVLFADSTGLWNAYAVTGGVDTDSDGKPELFVSGEIPDEFSRHTRIYQGTAGGRIEHISTISPNSFGIGEYSSLARLEPGGPWSFLWYQNEPVRRVQFYQSTTPGSWTLQSEYPDPTKRHVVIHAFDSNRNGRDEVYWMGCCSGIPSWILERPTAVTDSPLSPSAASLVVVPTPVQGRSTIFLRQDVARRARLWSAYDVAGHRVLSSPTNGRSSLLFDAQSLRAGVYFLSIIDAANHEISSGRFTVIRSGSAAR